MIQLISEVKGRAGCTGTIKSSVTLLTTGWVLIWFSLLATCAYSESIAPDSSGETAPDHKVEAVVVTGSRTPTVSPGKMTVPVQVVTGGQLKEIGAISLGQALEALQGVELLQSPDLNAAPGVQTLRMRGMDANHVLVLINGRRLPGTRPDNQGVSFTDISGINISDIDRIEVLRDGASAQYGSDAVAGVINIVMRKYNPRLSVNSQYGISSRSDAQEKQIEVSGGIPVGEKLFVNVGANSNQTDHYDRTPKTARWSAPDVDQTGANLKCSLDISASQALDGELRYNRTKTLIRKSVRGEIDENRISKKEDLQGGLTWGGEFETLRFEAGLSMARSDTEYRHSEKQDYEGDVVSDVQDAFVHVNWDYRAWVSFFAGASFNRQDVDAPYRAFVESRNTYAVFAESRMTFFDRLIVQLSGRLEEYSDFGTNFAPKVSVRYEWSDNLSFRTSVSRSFQVPTLYQLHDRFAEAMGWNDIYGNPDLDPAEGVNVNLGVVWTPFGPEKLKLAADVYRNDIDNMIETYFIRQKKGNESAITSYTNLDGTSSFTGVELEASMPLPWGFRVDAMAGYLKAEGEGPKGEDLTNRPRSRLNLTLNYSFNKRLKANLRYVYRGKYLSDSSPHERIAPFDYFNAQVTYALTPSISLFAGGRNLFDETPPVDLEKYESGHMESMLDSTLGAFYYCGVRLSF